LHYRKEFLKSEEPCTKTKITKVKIVVSFLAQMTDDDFGCPSLSPENLHGVVLVILLVVGQLDYPVAALPHHSLHQTQVVIVKKIQEGTGKVVCELPGLKANLTIL
jgi:hypothetical protein